MLELGLFIEAHSGDYTTWIFPLKENGIIQVEIGIRLTCIKFTLFNRNLIVRISYRNDD